MMDDDNVDVVMPIKPTMIMLRLMLMRNDDIADDLMRIVRPMIMWMTIDDE